MTHSSKPSPRAGGFLSLVNLAALATLMPRPSAAQSASYETLYSFKGSPDGADPKGDW
ncbi:MAG TPA: hypothetical protein VN924_22235 [Bryobacteraceae bacterium]|nr:hypothetical protein [Bryobacteraceae bacterium]